MNTHIQIYKTKSRHASLYMVLCLVISALGLMGLVLSFLFRRSFIPLLHDSGYFVLFFNGLITYWMVRDSIKKAKYFVAWNDHEIRYLLPKSEQTESIKIESIKTLDVKNNEVIIELDSETKRLNLNSIFYPERKMITDFFEGIDEKLNTKRSVGRIRGQVKSKL